jgi:drug/metabolite transporter (DMT)-like permease
VTTTNITTNHPLPSGFTGRLDATLALKLVLTALFWGGTFIAGRVLAQAMPLMTAAAGRFAVAAVLLVVLAFEYINGFHDTANAIATVVSTKVLTPRQALLLASSTNLIGAFFGQAVAQCQRK